ncbi:MAG: DUF3810 family protein [Vicinamibacterales bacterium]
MKPEPVRGAFVLPIAAVALLVAPIPAWIVESLYARDIYPWLQMALTSISNLATFSVLDALLALVVALLLYRLVMLFQLARKGRLLDAIWEGLKRGARAAAVFTLVFLLAWGLNYRRRPLEATMTRVQLTEPSVEGLQEAFGQVNTLAGRLRPSVVNLPVFTIDEVAVELGGPMNEALRALQRAPLTVPGHPKHSIVLSPIFRRAGVDGMLNPYGLESILNEDLLPFERPFVLAHEWAHLAGQADEAEASAVGWLACMNGPPAFAYSASVYLINEIQAAMPPDVRRQALARLNPGVREDLVALAERLQQENPAVQRAVFRVYDEYLKANRVPGGTLSYGRALRLILSQPIRDALTNYR